MRRLDSPFGMLAIVLLSASLAESASAGYWEVVYDLAGSTLQTVPPIGPPVIDPITGTLTVRYGAATQSAPLSSAKLVAGHTNVQTYHLGSLILITGSTDMNLIPQVGGAPGTLNGASLTWIGVVGDSSTTGFLHCNEVTQSLGMCFYAYMAPTVPVPQTPTGPGPFPQSFPKFVFSSGTGGTGGFTSTVLTQTALSQGFFTLTLYTTYVGREVSRVWNDPQPLPSISFGGLALLAGLVLGTAGWLIRRRRVASA